MAITEDRIEGVIRATRKAFEAAVREELTARLSVLAEEIISAVVEEAMTHIRSQWAAGMFLANNSIRIDGKITLDNRRPTVS